MGHPPHSTSPLPRRYAHIGDAPTAMGWGGGAVGRQGLRQATSASDKESAHTNGRIVRSQQNDNKSPNVQQHDRCNQGYAHADEAFSREPGKYGARRSNNVQKGLADLEAGGDTDLL